MPHDPDNSVCWVDLVMDRSKSIINQFVSKSKEDVELVKSYEDKITEGYAGSVPGNFSVNDADL